MRQPGQLFVFEGADGVGKSELSKRFAGLLEQRGVRTLHLSFPGMEDGTIGKLVYDVHHAPAAYGVRSIAASSMQLLHVAAHLDTIERRIIPALESGVSVVLDRFWWSTKVYGLAAGVSKRLLDSMIAVEIAAWSGVTPTRVILIQRVLPLRPEPKTQWNRWTELYESIAVEEAKRVRVVRFKNEGSLEKADRGLARVLDASDRETEIEAASQLPLDLPPERAKIVAPALFTSLSPAQPTAVYDTYWRFAAERQEIFFRRCHQTPPPWTSDPILTVFKFTNAYRASDRVSQYLIQKVIYRGEQSEEEIFFRTILFKLFNKIETWELLESAFGHVSYHDFSFEAYDDLLMDALSRSETIYSGAYIMPSGSSTFGTTKKHRAHLRLLERMMNDEVALRIAESKSMGEAFTLLRSYPTIGDFLAYQYVTDLNYSTLTNFSEMEFVVPGPGARSGISKCFESLGGLSEADIIRVVTDRQTAEFERLGISFKSLWGRPLQLIDCQNLFCEVDKYSRVYHPEIAGNSQRTRIKQKFRPTGGPVEYWYPPKWGLNDTTKHSHKEVAR